MVQSWDVVSVSAEQVADRPSQRERDDGRRHSPVRESWSRHPYCLLLDACDALSGQARERVASQGLVVEYVGALGPRLVPAIARAGTAHGQGQMWLSQLKTCAVVRATAVAPSLMARVLVDV